MIGYPLGVLFAVWERMAMPPRSLRDQRHTFIVARQTGQDRYTAAAAAGIARSTARRWDHRFQQEGLAFREPQRHGHPSKFRPAVQQWLQTYCTAHPDTPSQQLIPLLAAEFGITVGLSRLNTLRAQLGISYQRPAREKKVP